MVLRVVSGGTIRAYGRAARQSAANAYPMIAPATRPTGIQNARVLRRVSLSSSALRAARSASAHNPVLPNQSPRRETCLMKLECPLSGSKP